jgi:LysM repeat protein
MTYTREQWAEGMLHALGNASPTSGIIEWVVAWTRFETTSGQGAAYNLLNTTGTAPGSTDFNHLSDGIGVQNFPSFAEGVATNARVLHLPYYPVLCDALLRNVPMLLSAGWSEQIAINRELETWGTGAVALKILGIIGQGLEDAFPGSGPLPAAVHTYLIVSGDTLSGIAARFAIPEETLYASNVDAIEQAARDRGLASSDHGYWIFPGTVLHI